MRKFPTPVVALILTAVVAGCTVGPDYQAPRLDVPGQFSEAPGTQPAPATMPAATTQPATQPAPLLTLRWWREFHDPMLENLIDRAMAGNPDLKVAIARIRESRAAESAVRTGLFPVANATASYSRNHQGKNATAVPFAKEDFDQYRTGFDASWELDLFGRVRRSIEAADADAQALEEDSRQVFVTLLGDVGRAYMDLRGLQAQLQIVRENLQTQRDTLELTRSRYRSGLTTELDVLRAQALVSATESEIPSLTAALRQSQHRLALLLGQAPEALNGELAAETPIPGEPLEIPVGLPSELLQRRPDVRRAERQLAAATARIGVATADLFPRFSLNGSVGLASQQLKDLLEAQSLVTAIGPNVSWQIFDAGRIRANIRAQEARVDQALWSYKKAVLGALGEVADALSVYHQEHLRYRMLLEAEESQRRALGLANQLYTQGLLDFLSVLDAQRALFQAQDQRIQSRRALSVNVVSLYKALGGGWGS